MSDSSLHVVYALLDPRNDRVAYVGRTTRNPRKRLREHSHKISPNNRLEKWKMGLDEAGVTPTMQVLYYGDEDDVKRKERRLIRKYDRRNGVLNREHAVSRTSAEDVLPESGDSDD